MRRYRRRYHSKGCSARALTVFVRIGLTVVVVLGVRTCRDRLDTVVRRGRDVLVLY